ncbi:MAG: 4a-hydroxytetrahydrobiopterin dehydratase [Verrucomicrobiota bacterium]|nr:4a-hydroxytetrahydrobiopterin dehydratase [Verrucomicrobiota bacterium]
MGVLGAAEIEKELGGIPEWRKNGNVIQRTFQFKNFVESIQFVNFVANLAEKAQHHPDILIQWNKVEMRLTTHDAGGLTSKDFQLASEMEKQFEQLKREHE